MTRSVKYEKNGAVYGACSIIFSDLGLDFEPRSEVNLMYSHHSSRRFPLRAKEATLSTHPPDSTLAPYRESILNRDIPNRVILSKATPLDTLRSLSAMNTASCDLIVVPLQYPMYRSHFQSMTQFCPYAGPCSDH